MTDQKEIIVEKEPFKVSVTPIKSQGKKTKLVEWIHDTLEDIKHDDDYLYIEPFVGTGAVGFNIAPKNALFADINPHLINFYNAIKNRTVTSRIVREYLTREGELLLLKGEAHYYEVRDRFNKEGSPLDFLFVTRSCFNGMMRFNKKGGFNVPFCKKPARFAQAYVTKITNQVAWLEKKIHSNNWRFEIADFKTILEKYKGNPNVIYYLDAPYVLRHSDYFNGWGEKEEEELFNGLSVQEGMFILSTWYGNDYRKNPYFETFWSGFDIKMKSHTYQVGPKEENRNEIWEALVISKKEKS